MKSFHFLTVTQFYSPVLKTLLPFMPGGEPERFEYILQLVKVSLWRHGAVGVCAVLNGDCIRSAQLRHRSSQKPPPGLINSIHLDSNATNTNCEYSAYIQSVAVIFDGSSWESPPTSALCWSDSLYHVVSRLANNGPFVYAVGFSVQMTLNSSSLHDTLYFIQICNVF